MPMKLNIGLSRKVGEANYGSRGASVNVELEVDGSLAAEPTKLHERIRQLFALVRNSLAEELNGGNHHAAGAGNGNGGTTQAPNSANAGSGGSREPTSPGNGRSRPATPSQVKAIYGIARSQQINLAQLLGERFSANRPDELTIQEASRLIDELKRNQPGQS